MDPESCTFEMTAIGPIFPEQETMPEHEPYRNKTAALERGLADELKRRGYDVLGSHPRMGAVDPQLMAQVKEKLEIFFPVAAGQNSRSPRFQLVTASGPETASGILLADRDRF